MNIMPRDLSDHTTMSLDLPMADPALLPHGPLCSRCYSEDAPHNHVEFACTHDPVKAPRLIGMYHCPDCRAMVLEGHPHGPICRACAREVHGDDYKGSERRGQ